VRAAARRVSRARGGNAPVSILATRVLRTEDRRFLTTGEVYTEDVHAVSTGPDLAALRRKRTRAC
jgi:hypothetical protein